MTLGQRKLAGDFLSISGNGPSSPFGDHTPHTAAMGTWLKKFAVAILVVALLFVVALIALIQCRVMTCCRV